MPPCPHVPEEDNPAGGTSLAQRGNTPNRSAVLASGLTGNFEFGFHQKSRTHRNAPHLAFYNITFYDQKLGVSHSIGAADWMSLLSRHGLLHSH